MQKQLLIGAFEFNGLNLATQGLWARDDHNSVDYKNLSRWTELARLLDRGGFDFLFLADSYGYPVIDGELPDVALEQAVDIPKNDPIPLIPALGAVTENLSFAVTGSTTYEAPYANARRFATLDHLTDGRVAWNVVTTSSEVAARLFGHDAHTQHDQRYRIADEFMDLSYRLFEGSWEDDAVVADKARRVYAAPGKVHEIDFAGEFFKCQGVFATEPSAQRTPVIFQAGASSTGRAFAGKHAEVVFLQGRDASTLKKQVQSIREIAVESGRDPHDLKAVVGLSAVVGKNREDAQRRVDDYLAYSHREASRVYYAFMTGINLAALQDVDDLGAVKTEVGQTQLERYAKKSPAEAFDDFAKRGLREFILVGDGKDIAEQIAQLVDETDIDGINYAPFVNPGSYEDFVEHVMPELKAIGLVPGTRTPMTFRERIFGEGSRISPRHPAAAYRR